LSGRSNQLQALFRSDDAGETWVRITDDQHQFGSIGRVTGDPRVFGRVYFATGGRGIIYGDLASTGKQPDKTIDRSQLYL
jgi:xyloglucan-specific exo-beta-1,4-glucanase